MNALRLSAEIVERDALRYTPAGVPILEFRLSHSSEAIEAGVTRRVEFEMPAIAIGDPSRLIVAAPLASPLVLVGFIARRSSQSKTLVFHVTGFETQY